MKIKKIVLIVCLLAGLAGLKLSAQAAAAAVHESVTDPAWAVQAEAQITVLNASMGISTKAKFKELDQIHS